MSAGSLIPTDEQIERERAHRRQLASESPLRNPPPGTIDELRTECQQHRARILAALRDGVPILLRSNQNFAALLTGNADGFMLPSLARLFDSAVALDLGDAPVFQREPQTGRDAVAALDKLLAWCQAKQGPSPTDPKELKQPPDDALKCYRLSLATGKRQTELAEILSHELHRPIGQSAVSRWLKQVKRWLEAGNVLPDLTADSGPKPTTIQMDPAKIDRGDGRKKAIRPRRSADADRADELAKLIAEQQGEDDYDFDPIRDDDD